MAAVAEVSAAHAVGRHSSTIAVTAEGDGIYLYSSIVTQTTSGAAGALFGGAGTAVELQHIGGGAFMPISHEGTLGVE